MPPGGRETFDIEQENFDRHVFLYCVLHGSLASVSPIHEKKEEAWIGPHPGLVSVFTNCKSHIF